MADRNLDNRTVTQGVGQVKSDRAVGDERPSGTRSRRRRTLDSDDGLSRAEGSERANIAGGAVSNDDDVSKGGA
jgi:hypothetical protein